MMTLDFPLFSDREEYHSIYRLRDKAGRELTDLWEVDMITVKNEGMREAVEVVRESKA